MTWEQFVEQANAQLAERQLPRTIEIASIDWDRNAFGGMKPGVWVSVVDGRLDITED